MRKWLLMGMIMVFGLTAHAKSTNPTMSQEALTIEKNWLNVSRPLEVNDLRGRIVLIDFWTYCCINCMHVIPDLQYLERKFGDKLTVIGVHSAKFQNEKDSENIRNAVLRYDIEHPVVNDKDFNIWRKFGVRAWPTLILMNPDGYLVKTVSGEGHREELEELIANVIDEFKNKQLVTTPLPIALEKDKAPPTALEFPGKLAYDATKKRLFIADSGHNRILVSDLKGKVEEVAGSGEKGWKDGTFAEVQFSGPQGMAYSEKDDLLYVADTNNHLIRVVDLTNREVRTVAGTGEQGFDRTAQGDIARETTLASPWDVKFYPDDRQLMIAMAGTHQLWRYDTVDKTVSVVAGNGRESIDDGPYPLNSLSQPSGMAVLGKKLYFVDSETSSLRVLENNEITTLIGTGLFDFGFQDSEQGAPLLQHPLGVFAADGKVYIADSYNHSIREYDESRGELKTLFGKGIRGDFNEPNDVLKIGNAFYVADTNNHRIRILEDGQARDLAIELPMYNAGKSIAFISPDTLPNLKQTQTARVRPAEALPIHFQFNKGWKINDEAPSYLALFARGGDHAVATLSRDQLKTATPKFLVKMQQGTEYLVQGTLYYCEDRPDSVCEIMSISQEVNVVNSGNSGLVVDLK